MGFVNTLTCLIDALLNNNTKETMEAMKTMNAEDQKLVYEAYFIFAMMWTIGGAIADDKITNYRKQFAGNMKMLAKVKFPDAGECFEYRFEATQKEWVHWENWITKYEPIPGTEKMYQNIIVSTVEMERMKYILDLHVARQKPVLYVGIPGTGKTTIVKDYLADVKAKRVTT